MKTSVVVATRNNAATIGRCLASLVPYYQQGYISEIVVVDARSTDGTAEIARGFPVRLLPYGGGEPVFTYYARDIGWRNTFGELVLFIDSDAYVGEGFFPAIHEFFKDDKIGIVGAQERAVVTNGTSRTIGEWWRYHADNLRGLLGAPSSYSWFQRLYRRAAWGRYLTTSGPGYITRRTCLEATDGFERPEGSADILLSRRIIEKGWKATWWLEAPLYHHPPASVRHLIKQRLFFGKLDAVNDRDSGAYHKIMAVITRMGTPLLGLGLALRYRNPRHLVLFPLAHYAWIVGYLRELLRG